MDESICDSIPGLKGILNSMKQNRRDEIIDALRRNDKKYSDIVKRRTDKSMQLLEKIGDAGGLLEEYMNLVYEQQIYEIEVVYEQAFLDAVKSIKEFGLLN